MPGSALHVEVSEKRCSIVVVEFNTSRKCSLAERSSWPRNEVCALDGSTEILFHLVDELIGQSNQLVRQFRSSVKMVVLWRRRGE